MNPIRRTRRIASVLTGLALTWLALALAAPAAFAYTAPASGGGGTAPAAPVAQIRTVAAGGMAGWQITLIAVGAALAAATVAVLLDRARAARHTPLTARA